MFQMFRPSPTISESDVNRSLGLMVWEGVAAGALFSLGSGGFMAAYALALGANNLQVGIFAALPSITQIARLPSILAVERFRRRKAMGLPALIASHLVWLPIGLVPFMLDTPGSLAVSVVIVFLAIRGLFSSTWATAWTSWMRDLVPTNLLGSYHGRRLSITTAAVAAIGLGGSFFITWWKGTSSAENEIYGYSFLMIGGVLTFGMASFFLASRAKEPLMPAAPLSDRSALAVLAEPLQDRNFFQLIKFLFVWSLISSIAIPFFAVYMLKFLGLSLPAVIGFTVLSQATSILFMRVWGPMADRMGSKTVLSLSASLYLLVILGWVFTAYPDRHFLTLPLLAVLHLFAGVAAAGVTLTISTIALKVAPEGKATSFVGVAGIAASVGAGIGPIAGGLMADVFSTRALRINFDWVSPSGVFELSALSLTGFDFLFVIAFVIGLFTLNLLVALKEVGEVPRDIALGELADRAEPALRAISSVPGLGLASAFSYGYIKRVPGADVAMGVTAYQLAASSQAAVSSAGRGRELVGDVADSVGGVLEETIDEMEDVTDHGMELARHATRGAVHVGNDLTDQAGRVARGAVLGTLQTLARREIDPGEALRGAGYGIVQGAIERGLSPSNAVRQAVEAAREVAEELGLDAEDSATVLGEGALLAAEASGEEIVEAVSDALPDSVRERDEESLREDKTPKVQ